MKLSIIIPVYNERDNVEEVIRALQGMVLPKGIDREIIVIDDGSSDGTIEIIKQAFDDDSSVLIHSSRINFGKGTAIRVGLSYVTGDIVIVQDADLEYSVEDIPRIVQPIIDGDADIVYGSRFLKKHRPRGMRFSNWLANRILTLAANLLYGSSISDEATCYKAFRAEIIKSTTMTCKRFEFCPEITGKTLRRGFGIDEVPIEYEGRSVEEGKKIRWTDGVEAIWTLIKVRMLPYNALSEPKSVPKTKITYAGKRNDIIQAVAIFVCLASLLMVSRGTTPKTDMVYVCKTAVSLVNSGFKSTAIPPSPFDLDYRVRPGLDNNTYAVYEPLLSIFVIVAAAIGILAEKISRIPNAFAILAVLGVVFQAFGIIYAFRKSKGKPISKKNFTIFIFAISASFIVLILIEIFFASLAIVDTPYEDPVRSSTDLLYSGASIALLPIVACAFIAAMAYLLSRRSGASPGVAILASAAIIPGSYLIWHIFPHTRDVYFIPGFLLACYIALKSNRLGGWLLAGLLFGVSIAIKQTAILLSLGFVTLAIYRASTSFEAGRNRYAWLASSVSIFFVGPIIATAGNIIYNYYIFGTPNSYWLTPDQSIDSLFIGLFGFFLSPGKSIFLFAPITLFLLLTWRRLPMQARPLLYLFVGSAIPFVLFFSLLSYWSGDISWGPRYLLPLVPLAGALGVISYRYVNVRTKIILFLVILSGIAVNLPVTSNMSIGWFNTILKTYPGRTYNDVNQMIIFMPEYSPPVINWTNIIAGFRGKETFKSVTNPGVLTEEQREYVDVPVWETRFEHILSGSINIQEKTRIAILLLQASAAIIWMVLWFRYRRNRTENG